MASSTGGKPGSSGDAAIAAAAQEEPSDLGATIQALQKEQKALKDKRKRLQTDLRNARKRKTRLSSRTRLLSDTDLMQILVMREANKKKEEAVEGRKTSDKTNPAPAGEAREAGEPKELELELEQFEESQLLD